MRVVCCHTNLRDETKTALDTHAPQVEYVDCRPDEEMYQATLERYWAAGEAFLCVEHDVVIDEAVVKRLGHCREPWCSYVYPLAHGFFPWALGCVRFSAELLRREPDAMEAAAVATSMPSRKWFRLDMRLDAVLTVRGYRPHVHGRVLHLNEGNFNADPDRAYIQLLEQALPAHL